MGLMKKLKKATKKVTKAAVSPIKAGTHLAAKATGGHGYLGKITERADNSMKKLGNNPAEWAKSYAKETVLKPAKAAVQIGTGKFEKGLKTMDLTKGHWQNAQKSMKQAAPYAAMAAGIAAPWLAPVMLPALAGVGLGGIGAGGLGALLGGTVGGGLTALGGGNMKANLINTVGGAAGGYGGAGLGGAIGKGLTSVGATSLAPGAIQAAGGNAALNAAKQGALNYGLQTADTMTKQKLGKGSRLMGVDQGFTRNKMFEDQYGIGYDEMQKRAKEAQDMINQYQSTGRFA